MPSGHQPRPPACAWPHADTHERLVEVASLPARGILRLKTYPKNGPEKPTDFSEIRLDLRAKTRPDVLTVNAREIQKQESSMNIGREIAMLHDMTVKELREKHQEVFGDPTRSGHKQYLVRRIAWRLQSLAEGDLSERARRRAMELARDADIRTTMPRDHGLPPSGSPGEHAPERTRVEHITVAPDDRLPLPGAQVTRKYKDQTYLVTVLPRGFEYNGEVYRTLSAVAKAITGTHWNGYHFFNLGKKGGNGTDE